MAQDQIRAFSVSIPVEEPLTIPSFDTRINAVLSEQQQKGYDLVSVIYVAGGSLPPHVRVFFARH